ncbi:hypothetical protein GWI33_015758 [Rhynchophorus ferrugineus]|uniref:Uncharacterized protein n=1 Tax=Rhynchophorus ferrugineus TaxID=354439 RepID=A0A834I3U0_RHYFE|nr:hypothetical protein GWI33_015758 [Rhynchophorus ferrugineus]
MCCTLSKSSTRNVNDSRQLSRTFPVYPVRGEGPQFSGSKRIHHRRVGRTPDARTVQNAGGTATRNRAPFDLIVFESSGGNHVDSGRVLSVAYAAAKEIESGDCISVKAKAIIGASKVARSRIRARESQTPATPDDRRLFSAATHIQTYTHSRLLSFFLYIVVVFCSQLILHRLFLNNK